MNFKTPDDYVRYLSSMYPIPEINEDEDNDDFIKLSRLEREKLGLPIGNIESDNINIVNAMVEDIKANINPDLTQEINDYIGFGFLYDDKINASIYKSNDNKYAIMFKVGLFTYLHKYIKLTLATTNPNAVIYCNRTEDLDNIKSSDYLEFIEELVKNYKGYGRPYGVMIRLNQELTIQHAITLHICELFIMCHELAHYLNGDLSKRSNFNTIDDGISGTFQENYSMEYNADKRGYQILEDILRKSYPHISDIDVFSSLNLLFESFNHLSMGVRSSTHPTPFERLYALIELIYGNEVKEKIERFHENGDFVLLQEVITKLTKKC